MDRNAPPDRRLRLSLRQLEAFCAVAMTGGVSSAARRLARTQSAVSTALGELESALGTALFERAGRGLRATDAARRLLPRALEVVERAVNHGPPPSRLAAGLHKRCPPGGGHRQSSAAQSGLKPVSL